MAIKFPISLAGKRGGGSITDDLVDWWDGGSTIGQFAGNDIGTIGATVANQPPTFSTAYKWSNNKNGYFGTLGCSFNFGAGKQTLGLEFIVEFAAFTVKPARFIQSIFVRIAGAVNANFSVHSVVGVKCLEHGRTPGPLEHLWCAFGEGLRDRFVLEACRVIIAKQPPRQRDCSGVWKRGQQIGQGAVPDLNIDKFIHIKGQNPIRLAHNF